MTVTSNGFRPVHRGLFAAFDKGLVIELRVLENGPADKRWLKGRETSWITKRSLASFIMLNVRRGL
jgi:hypothetical protein